MKQHHLTATCIVEQSPEEAFTAINNVRGWWSGEIEGRTDQLGAEFTYRYKDFHRSKQKITELVPGKRVVWHVVDSYLSFVEDKTEWDGTDIIFDITRKNGKTVVQFTHRGLMSDAECYQACSDAWGSYVSESLRDLIATGQGRPNKKES